MQQIILELVSSHKFDLKPNSLNLPSLQESHVKLGIFYYRHPKKLREGNVFTGVCLSTGGVSISGTRSPPGDEYVQGVGCLCPRGWVLTYPEMWPWWWVLTHPDMVPWGWVLIPRTRDTTGYGRQAGCTYPTCMLFCLFCGINENNIVQK